MNLHSSHLTRCILLLCLSWIPHASAVQLLLSDNAEAYERFALSMAGAHSQPQQVMRLGNAPVHWQGRLLVAVGARACQQALITAPNQGQLICSFIPSSAYAQLRQRYAQAYARLSFAGAIYLNQPAHRMLRLAREVSPDARTVGALFGPESRIHLPAFEQASQAQQLKFAPLVLTPDDDPVKRLRPALRRSDVFVVLPDHAVFNRAVAKWMLYMSLRQRIPLIGFSENYVRAGAVAAVYSTPEQLGRQTAQYLIQLQQDTLQDAEQFPVDYSVSVNRRVARVLRLALAPAEVLEAVLRQESKQ